MQKSNTDGLFYLPTEMMWPPVNQSKHSSPGACNPTEGCRLWETVYVYAVHSYKLPAILFKELTPYATSTYHQIVEQAGYAVLFRSTNEQ